MLNKEEMKRLVEAAKNDKDFAEKFTVAMKAKNTDETIRLAAEKGFTFKEEDFAFHLDCELDPEELEQVAGGRSMDDVEKMCGDTLCFFCGFGFASSLWA